jgi:hypothetical protein
MLALRIAPRRFTYVWGDRASCHLVGSLLARPGGNLNGRLHVAAPNKAGILVR